MGENRFSCSGGVSGAGRETFGIEANRILDACRDRDCFENTRVFLTGTGEEIVNRTGSVRVKSAKIVGANITVDPIQFNRGFYSVNIRCFVACDFEGCACIGQPQDFDGIAVLDKRVVLYGGESNVNVFRSGESGNFCSVPEPISCTHNDPEAVLEVVEPVVLGARIVEDEQECRCCCCCGDIPTQIAGTLNGTLADDEDNGRYLTISLGLFSVIRLVRPTQIMVQAGEYCIPDKECIAPDEDDPCGTFRQMPFPTAEFCQNGVSGGLPMNGGHNGGHENGGRGGRDGGGCRCGNS